MQFCSESKVLSVKEISFDGIYLVKYTQHDKCRLLKGGSTVIMQSKTHSCTIPFLPLITSEQPVNLQRELPICIKVWNKSAEVLLSKHSFLYILLYPWCFGLIRRVLVPANTCISASKIMHPIKITWYFATCCVHYMERVNWVPINEWWKPYTGNYSTEKYCLWFL